ncbi:MAG: C40 family peptidase [Vicinamibacterales bacterium]
MPTHAEPPVVGPPVTPGAAASGAVEPRDVAPTPLVADRVVRAALELRGTPYRSGGSDLRGFDCSGFTQYVFNMAGTGLPRETRDQFLIGTTVARGQQRPGDLIFFSTTAPGASHVGIALGGDAFVHAPSSRGVVRVEYLTLPYWSRRLVGIRRIETD